MEQNNNWNQPEDTVQIQESFNNELKTKGDILKRICGKLNCDAIEFKADEIVDLLREYKKGNKWDGRILYSDISNYIFELYNDNNHEDSSRIINNSKTLLEHVFKEDTKEQYKDVLIDIMRLYDHVNLSITQGNKINVIANKAEEQIKTVADETKKDVKNSERNYITILGIFASIVIGAVGAYQSVLSANASATTETANLLGLKIIGISFVVFNVLYILITFILKLNDKKLKSYYIFIGIINLILIGLFCLLKSKC